MQDKNYYSMAKNIVLSIIYFFRFFLPGQKRIFSFKKFTLAGILILTAIFSFSQINKKPINKVELSEEIIVETGLPIQAEEIEHDFQIAAWREPDDILGLSEESEIALIFGGSVLVAPETEINEKDIYRQTRTEIETYIVQPGDTISTIAETFGLNWNTIFWANNLNYWSVIKPGNELKILPVNGLTHTVKRGENISSIASKYKSSVEKIIEINNLSEELAVQPGMILIVPDGTPPPAPTKPKYVSPSPQLVQQNYSNYWDWRKNTDCHLFVSRQCTDWAAFKWASEQGQCVPSWSHARYWFKNAQKDGYETGNQPKQGAIMALTCTSWICGYYGHVAYVEDFDENTVTISEMNGLKRLEQSTRSFKNITNQWQGGWKILGYIYPKNK
ncbi:MAG: LysM peptidoglycan-binding domain-containing protein [Patescibacteria group bacterium]|nr:LysM peptidoglycan-binding domain-containing protein [Patescibacteria group bacterium]